MSAMSMSEGFPRTTQAKVIVYWAITDLCTDQKSQRQDHWRDGQ